MLRTVLGLLSDTPTFVDLQEALRVGEEDAALESGQLDFKSVLPASGSSARFAKAVTAFANRGGGVLVYGVKDQDERAAKWTLVELGEKVTSLHRQLNQATRPLVPNLRWVTVPSPDDPSRGALLVVVPPSPLAPHAVVEGHRMDFYWRQGRESVLMNEGDLERAYRERSMGRERSRAEFERARGWMHAACSSGALYVLGRPSTAVNPIYESPGVGLATLSELVRKPVVSLEGRAILGSYPRTRVRRLVSSQYNSRSGAEKEGELTVLRDDGLAAVWWEMELAQDLQASNRGKSIDFEKLPLNLSCYTTYTMLLHSIIMPLVGVREMYRAFGVVGDVELVLGIRTGGAVLWHTSWPDRGQHFVLDEDIEFDFQVSMDELCNPLAFGRLVGQIHSDVLAGFGLHLGPPVDEEGKFYLEKLTSDGWEPQASSWKEKGLELR